MQNSISIFLKIRIKFLQHLIQMVWNEVLCWNNCLNPLTKIKARHIALDAVSPVITTTRSKIAKSNFVSNKQAVAC